MGSTAAMVLMHVVMACMQDDNHTVTFNYEY
jgi:hypothetical protein